MHAEPVGLDAQLGYLHGLVPGNKKPQYFDAGTFLLLMDKARMKALVSEMQSTDQVMQGSQFPSSVREMRHLPNTHV